MNAPDPPPPDAPGWSVAISAGLLAAAAALAYGGSLTGPFLYDDTIAIARNPTLRHLLASLAPPPGGLPVSGRPVVNFSLALNYALNGLNVTAYHVLNLLIHVLAGLTLFGLARRTLMRLGAGGQRSTGLALVMALLWTVHPLQTEAVTYLSQRAESLMGLFYLLTLYCFIRRVEGDGGGARLPSSGWTALSMLFCLLGMGTKEVMVSAPIMVFLYDRTFISGSFGQAWKRHRGVFLGLAASWLVLAYLVATGEGRGGTAGFGTSVPWWGYALTQFRAVAHYLRLCFWPHPLAFDYGLILGGPTLEMAWDILLVTGMVIASATLVFRGSPLGFLGAWYFLILAPSSSVVPVATEIIAEHRVYLPLAAVVAGAVYGCDVLIRRLAAKLGLGSPWIVAAGVFLSLAVASVLGRATYCRNQAYLSVLAFWTDAVEKTPESAGARNNLGNALAERADSEPEANRRAELMAGSIAQFRAALRLAPDFDDPHYNLGNALSKEGKLGEAIPHYRAALRFRPDDAAIHYGLGNALRQLGEKEEGEREYERALEGKSDSAQVWYNLGNALLDEGRLPDAARALAMALRIRPDYADALANSAGVLAQLGRGPEAVAQFQAALRLEPNAADLHNNLGGLLAESGRLREAQEEFERALRIKPDYREARDNLARVQAMEQAAGRP